MQAKPVAIVGAGTLGRQIAICLAASETPITVTDSDPAVRGQALALMLEETDRAVAAGELAGEARNRVARIAIVDDLAAVADGAWLVIEAIPERLEAKRALFADLSELTGRDVVLATNSSSFRSRLLADVTRHPERLLNTHFYGAPWRRPAVELMSCGSTEAAVMTGVSDFFAARGLEPFVVRGESTGFIFNRIWRAIKRESLRVVADGHATPEEVDRIWRIVMETADGPFARMDRVGLDVVIDIERRYAAESGDPDDEPPAFLAEMIERGDLGIKSGRGFYDYEE